MHFKPAPAPPRNPQGAVAVFLWAVSKSGSGQTVRASGTTVCVMSEPKEDAAYCNRRAEEFRRMGAQETDSNLKQGYSLLEERWLRLAASYSHPECVNAVRAAIAADRADNG
jgi:hypothetical protein